LADLRLFRLHVGSGDRLLWRGPAQHARPAIVLRHLDIQARDLRGRADQLREVRIVKPASRQVFIG
jgi:hypothetical protein